MNDLIRANIDTIAMLAVLATAILIWITAAGAREDRHENSVPARFGQNNGPKGCGEKLPVVGDVPAARGANPKDRVDG